MTKKITNNDLYVEIIKINSRFDELDEKFVTKEEFSEKHNLVMDTLDKVLGEVITTRQEQVANSQRFDDTDKEIGGLKNRVKKLEDKQLPHQS